MIIFQTHSDSRVVDTITQAVMPKLQKILDCQQQQQQQQQLPVLLPPVASKWDDADASPSPPRKSGTTAAAASLSIHTPLSASITSTRFLLVSHNYGSRIRCLFDP
jgi:hypothetical protein